MKAIKLYLWRLRFWWRMRGLRPLAGGVEGDVFEGFDGASGASGLTDMASNAVGSFQAPPTTFSPGSVPTGDVGGRSGFSDWISKLGAGIGKEFSDSPLSAFTKTLGIGATGLGVANQFNTANQLAKQTGTIQKGEKAASDAAAPAVAFGTDTLNNASKGNLTPALQASIDQWTQRAKADIRARLSSMGLGNSTDIESYDQQIDQTAQAMKGQMLAQQETTGLAGLQTGVSAGTGVMGVASQQQAQLEQLIQSANQALGQMSGRAPA